MRISSKKAARHMLRGTAAAVMGLAVCGGAWAVSLGRITLQSTRGEPLRAEIDLGALSAEELASLSARIAPPEVFSRAGVAYSPALSGARASVQQRADGSPVLRLSSDAPVQDTFLDLILQIEWASGRLSREYTLLFEAAQPPAAVAPPAPAAPVLGAAPTAPATSPASSTSAGSVTPAPAEPPADRYTVRRGDTLSGVAARMQAQGVSLDQLLVALFRGNPHAFVGQNMNRLRSDTVLRLPAPEQAKEIARAEARQVVRLQSADFNEYRLRLAQSAPAARVDESARRAGGAVEAAVEDRRTARQTPDRLRLSRAAAASSAEAALAREAERREQSQRVAELSRNVEDLKRLATNSPAATVPAQGQPPVPTPTPAPVAPTPAASAPAEAEQASAPQATAAASAAASAAEPVAAAAAASAAAEAKAATLPAAAAQAPAGGVMGFLSRSWGLLLGGGAAALALLGVGFVAWRRRNKPHAETSFLESRLQPESFFGGAAAAGAGAGAPAAAAAAAESDPYSLSQLDAIGDVDPVAEADVYLAYGRDLQAEEILKEALRGNPQHLGIRTKLLEVYAKRHDVRAFEHVAQQVHDITEGRGEDWDKVREMGLQIDPDNPLYAGGLGPSARAPASEVPSTWIATEPPALAASERLDLDLEQLESVPPSLHDEEPAAVAAEPAPQAKPAPEPEPEPKPEIDLGFDPELEPAPQPLDLSLADEEVAPLDLSLAQEDLGLPAAEPAPADVDLAMPELSLADEEADREPVTAAEEEFTFGEDDLMPPVDVPARAAPQEAAAAPQPAVEDDLPELDFGLSDFPANEEPPQPTAAPQPPEASPSLPFDLDSLSLDLDESATPAALEELNISGFGDDADPLERKLELAEEFRQIGDTDGARDLLQEVLEKAQGPLKERAQGMLESLV